MECPGCACDPRSFPMLDDTLLIDGAACAMSDRKDMSIKVSLKKRRTVYQVGRNHLVSYGFYSQPLLEGSRLVQGKGYVPPCDDDSPEVSRRYHRRSLAVFL